MLNFPLFAVGHREHIGRRILILKNNIQAFIFGNS